MALVPIHSWQFHKLDVSYVSRTLKLTKNYNVNTVIYSHDMVRKVSQLYDATDRGKKLTKLARRAHDLDLRVWIWIHELESDVPSHFLESGVVYMDRPDFWNWLSSKYERLFTDHPEFDGIVMTLSETEYKIFGKNVHSELSMPDRFAKIINTIDDVCRKNNKDFIVRSFLYEPQEMQWFSEGLKKVNPHVMLMSKCVPHDWQPFYPHNPLIGKFPNRKMIVEFDCSSEFTGKNCIPYASPEYFEYRWRYALSQPGVAGYNARIDHEGYDAVYTPNEINLYTLYRLTEDPNITAEDIWDEWTKKRYGEKAAKYVKQALQPSFKVVNNSFFALGFWITNHSKLPSFRYADGHISSRSIAKWKPDEPKYRDLERKLKHPDAELLEMILAEKDEAIAMADEMLLHLSQAKPYLKEEQYEDLYWRLNLLRRVATIWKLHAEAFFGYKVLAEGQRVSGLESRVKRAIHGLRLQDKVSRIEGIKDPPGTAEEIESVAYELESMINDLLG